MRSVPPFVSVLRSRPAGDDTVAHWLELAKDGDPPFGRAEIVTTGRIAVARPSGCLFAGVVDLNPVGTRPAPKSGTAKRLFGAPGAPLGTLEIRATAAGWIRDLHKMARTAARVVGGQLGANENGCAVTFSTEKSGRTFARLNTMRPATIEIECDGDIAHDGEPVALLAGELALFLTGEDDVRVQCFGPDLAAHARPIAEEPMWHGLLMQAKGARDE